MIATIVWRNLDPPGHEACRLSAHGSGWRLEGAAVFSYEQQPCRLSYTVSCDSAWRTRSAVVSGWVGRRTIAIEIAVDDAGRWQLNGRAQPEVAGCLDVDLNFSPCTNMLPIRRLGLAVGQASPVRAAWLRFPSFALEPLAQRYQRIDDASYRYESLDSGFVALLQVNAAGFVTMYADIWQAEATTIDD
jgi:hypothetical protein